MDPKGVILEAVKQLGILLAGQDVNWLIGGSGALLLHGLDVTPNDIDLVVDPQAYIKAKTLLKDLLVKVATGDTLDTPFKINGVRGEVLARPIKDNLLEYIDLDSVKIPVHSLKTEYEFYKNRTDNIEKNKHKLQLIEEALQK